MLKIISLYSVYLIGMQMAFAIDKQIVITGVTCFDGIDGKIEVQFNESDYPYVIRLMDSKNNRVIQKKELVSISNHVFQDLKSGEYILQILHKGSAMDTLIQVPQPEQLKAIGIELIKVQGDAENVLADIKLMYSGGTPPYAITWSENTNNQSEEIAQSLTYGIYRCSLNDINNCGPKTATFFLFEDEVEKFKKANKSVYDTNK